MKNHMWMAKRLAMAGVLVGLCVMIALLLLGTDEPAPAPPRQAVATAAEAKPARPATTSAPSAAPQAKSFDLPALMPDELMAQILKKDKKLGMFMDYHNTVLMSAQRRDEYRKLLADADMMKYMADALMDPGSGRVDPEEYYHRLMQVDYFEAALAWKDNPQREKVLGVMSDIVAKDNFQGGQDTTRRQMLGGTKMEVYRLMYEQDPAKTRELMAQAKGTRMEGMVTWMGEEEIRRRTREQQIQKEVEELQAKAN
jgi:hypothetical protein